jgi:hypothetical protein
MGVFHIHTVSKGSSATAGTQAGRGRHMTRIKGQRDKGGPGEHGTHLHDTGRHRGDALLHCRLDDGLGSLQQHVPQRVLVVAVVEVLVHLLLLRPALSLPVLNEPLHHYAEPPLLLR